MVAFYLKVPISPDELLENARRSGRFSCAGIAAGVVREKKWAELACAEIITTAIFSLFERALAALKKTRPTTTMATMTAAAERDTVKPANKPPFFTSKTALKRGEGDDFRHLLSNIAWDHPAKTRGRDKSRGGLISEFLRYTNTKKIGSNIFFSKF